MSIPQPTRADGIGVPRRNEQCSATIPHRVNVSGRVTQRRLTPAGRLALEEALLGRVRFFVIEPLHTSSGER